MSTPVKLRLYCSICARNDFYMDRIRAVADGLAPSTTTAKRRLHTLRREHPGRF